MEPDVKTPHYVQQWLPGFAPTAQPSIPGSTGEDEIEPSVSDLETCGEAPE